MANLIENKYSLKTIHDEIDLFDRKLAHMQKYESFATDADRDAAVRKLTLKRELLVTTAKRMVADGVEFKENDLPRSFRPKDAPVEVTEVVAEEAKTPVAAGEKRSVRRQASAFAGTSLDWEQSVKHYMEKKAKA